MMADKSGDSPTKRGDDVRLKLIDAAIETFGRYGFEGASTRMMATAAGVNLQAIPYYFGGKEGLYLAAADHIADRLTILVGPVGERIRARLGGGDTPTPAEARALLCELLETIAHVLVADESATWARFIVGEQMQPTAAFDRLYDKIMARLLEAARGLIGTIRGEDPACEPVRLCAVTLLGQILVFRVANAAVMRQLSWSEIGAREFAAIRDTLHQAVAAITPARDGASA
jgi:AcrR family transcriptional regulator